MDRIRFLALEATILFPLVGAVRTLNIVFMRIILFEDQSTTVPVLLSPSDFFKTQCSREDDRPD